MNKENVAKLIAALRSGDYTQAKETLRDEKDNYCCLGVACDLSGLGTWEKTSFPSPGWSYVIRDENGKKIAFDSSRLPWPVAQWLGIDLSGGVRFPDYGFVPLREEELEDNYNENKFAYDVNTDLASLNDDNMTFTQIADILENADMFEWKPAPKTPETPETMN